MMIKQGNSFTRCWTFPVLLLLTMLPVCAFAAEIHVPSQYSTIQAAINAAQDGDIIVVQTGIYTENINFHGKSIVLTSTDPLNRSIVSATIIDGSLNGSTITFNSRETSSSILSGFTVRGGNGTIIDERRYGGGIYIGKGCSPTIRHNLITDNIADIGGAIYIHGNSAPTITYGPAIDYPYVGIGQTIALSVTATDPDGDDLVYNWIPREGGTITGKGSTVSFSAATAGVYHIDLTVDDQYGGTATGTVSVIVIGISIQTPVPQLIVGQSASILANVVPLIANSSEYPVSITWSLIEGPAAGTFDAAVNGTPEATSIPFTPGASGPGRIQAKYKVGGASITHSVAISLNPIVLGIEPASGIQSTTVQATITGHNLGRVNAVALSGEGITATIKAGKTEDSLPIQFVISQSAEPGNRTIILSTPEGQFNTLVTFQIRALPAITGNPTSLNLVVGDTGKITFSAPDPAPAGGLSLVLSSSAPIVATVPPSATIPEGQKSVEVTVTAVGYGTTTITANATGYSKAQVPITVINPPLITFSPSPLSVAVGLVEKCTINVSNPAPTGGLIVNLTGGGGKVEIPATVTISESKTSAAFNTKGLAEGTVIITATATGYPAANLQVNVTPAQFNLFPSYLPIAVGRSSTLLLSVPNAAPAGGLTVSIASSNTVFVTTPATVAIPEGERSAFVAVNGVGVGSATITASLTGFKSAQATVNVLQAYNISFIPNSLAITPGTSQTTDVVVSSPAPQGGLTITLSNPSPDKVSVPSSVVILEGQFKNTISVSGLDTTSSPVIVNASCPGLTDGQLSVTVHPKYQPWIKADVTVGVGTQTTGAVGLTGATAPAGGYTINLASKGPTIATVPATVTIPAGSSVVTFTIVGKAVGTTDIMASVSGFTATSGPVTAVKPTFEWLSVPTQMTLGAMLGIQVQTYVPNGSYYYPYYDTAYKSGRTNQVVDQALTVSLSSENPVVIQVPTSATITVGSYYTSSFNIQAVGTGSSTITASAAGWDSKTSGTITVVGPWIKADVTVGVGTQTTGAVGLTGATAPAGGYTINLVSNGPTIATVPATVTIPQGSSAVTFTIVGKAVGTTDIMASVSGFTATSGPVTAVKPTFEWLSVPTQMTLGATAGASLYTYVANGCYYYQYYSTAYKSTNANQVTDGAVTVTLSSGNPAVIQVPATATIAAGNYYSSSFNIQAAGTGTSTLTASASGWDSKTSDAITVVGPWLMADVTVGAGCQTTGGIGLTGAAAPAGGYTLNLTSNDPTIASVPATVTIPQGQDRVGFIIVGRSPGTTQVMVSVGGFSATSTVTVVKPTFYLSVPTAQMTLGASANGSIYTYVPNGSYWYSYYNVIWSNPNQSVDQALTVSLSSENPSVIQVPATVTIPAGSYYQNFNIQAAGTGTSTLTASASGWDSKTSDAITVVGPVGPWLMADVTVGAGCQTTGGIGLTGAAAPAGGYTVNLTSNDPTIVSVPATVTITENWDRVGFTIVGRNPGTAQIIVSVGGFSATSTVTVVKPTFDLSVPAQMTLGASANGSIYTYVPNGSYWYSYYNVIWSNPNQSVDQALTMSLSSENPAVIQVPATTTIAAGNGGSQFSMQAVGTGSSRITASAVGWDSKTAETITVVGPWIDANVTVGAGCLTTGGVGLTGATAPEGGYTLNLTSNDPTIASVPATVTIPENQDRAGFTIVGRSPGTTQVMVSVGGFSATSTVTVVKPTFSLGVPSQMTLGAGANGNVYTYVPNGSYWHWWYSIQSNPNQGVDQALTVSLSSENPAVIQVPATVTIPAGGNGLWFSMQAVGTDSSTITASAVGWDSNTTGTITVVGPWIMADVTVGVGCRTTGGVVLTGATAPAGGYTLNLTSNDPTIASVPATVTIPENWDRVDFTIVGHTPGTTTVRATALGLFAEGLVTVVTPIFQWNGIPANMELGTTESVQILTDVPNGSYWYRNYNVIYGNPNQAVDQALTVSLLSENPAVIQAPSTETIEAGSYGTPYFNIQAVGTGTSTLTASALGWDSMTTGTITVQ